MATNTPNYNLIKPDLTDNVDIDDINTNMDIIDGAMNDNATDIGVLQTDVVTLTREIQETAERTAAYTIALDDAGKIVQMNASSAVDVTVPLNSAVAFPIGSIVGVYNRSSDDVTVVGDSGVDVRNAGSVPQFGEVSLRKRATNEWVMVGA
jgi:hypothetical protein